MASAYLVLKTRHLDAAAVVVLDDDKFSQRYLVELEQLMRSLSDVYVAVLGVIELFELSFVLSLSRGFVSNGGGGQSGVGVRITFLYNGERRGDVIFVIVDGRGTCEES